MAENKTKATDASVTAYLDAIPDEERRRDCLQLARLMAKVSKSEPTMWGTDIIGFGTYHYVYGNGREGDWYLTGFASRKGGISIYLMGDFPRRAELLAQLGKHKSGSACLYVRKLSDVNLDVLEQLVAKSVFDMKQRSRTTHS